MNVQHHSPPLRLMVPVDATSSCAIQTFNVILEVLILAAYFCLGGPLALLPTGTSAGSCLLDLAEGSAT